MVETGGWGASSLHVQPVRRTGGAGVEVSLLTTGSSSWPIGPHRFDVDGCFDGNSGYLGNVKVLRRGWPERARTWSTCRA